MISNGFVDMESIFKIRRHKKTLHIIYVQGLNFS